MGYAQATEIEVSEDHAAIMNSMERCGGKLLQANDVEALILLPSENNLAAFTKDLEEIGVQYEVSGLNVTVHFKD